MKRRSKEKMPANAPEGAVGHREPRPGGTGGNLPPGFREYGLRDEDWPEVLALYGGLDERDPLALADFGGNINEIAARDSEKLLAQVATSDLGEAGEKLDAILLTAKRLNLGRLPRGRSRIPVAGRLADGVRIAKERLFQRFFTAKGHIDGLLGEIAVMQRGLSQRSAALDETYRSVVAVHRLLGLHIAAGKLKIADMRSRAAALERGERTPLWSQEIGGLADAIATLQHRVDEFIAHQHLALDMLPIVRVLQGTGRRLVEKLHTVRDITLPAWERNFVLEVSLAEHEAAVELATRINEATEYFLVRTVKRFRKTVVAAARASRRPVIGTDTLRTLHDEILGMRADFAVLDEDEARASRDSEAEIAAMRREMEASLARRAPEPGRPGGRYPVATSG